MSAPSLHSPIRFGTRDTVVLENPRTSPNEASKTRDALFRASALQSHVWVASSGSTASAQEKKWVALSQEAILASATAVNRHLQASASDAWMHALPVFHVGGIGIFARAELAGSSVEEGLIPEKPGLRRWDPLFFADRCGETGATLSALVPAQVHDLVIRELRAPRSLRAIVVGAGALGENLYRSARALGWPLVPSYGMSECASQIATADPGKDSMDLRVLSHIGIRETADGRLALRSPALFSGYGYVSETGARWESPIRDGWFESEDRGDVLPGGTLRIHGRTRDFVKIGGESVDLAKLEKILEESCARTGVHPANAAIVAVPDDRLGHVIWGAISGSASAAVFDDFDSRVLPFERVRKRFVIERIPRAPLGKLLRAELTEVLLSDRQRLR